MWKKTSASQIRTYMDCNRKWYFDKIVFPRDENEGSASTQLGTEVHSNLEQFIKGEGLLDHPLLTVNRFAYDICSLSNVEKLVEYEFFDTDSFRVSAHGFIDLVMIDRIAKKILVIDHKTTKDWKYAKKEADLRVDPQCQLYLWVLYKEYGDEWNYSFGHHVILTKEAAPERVTVIDVTVEQIKKGKAQLDDWISRQFSDSRALDHTFVDPTYTSCYKFGKCPYWDYCKGEKKVPSLAETLKKDTVVPPAAAPSIIYIDCMPVPAGTFVTFEDWIADLAAEYEKDVGEHYLVTKYNEGAKAVALEAHKQVLSGKKTLPTALICRGGNPAVSFFENFHYGMAQIVKGVR